MEILAAVWHFIIYCDRMLVQFTAVNQTTTK